MTLSTTMDAPASVPSERSGTRKGGLFSADRNWAIAFAAPYVAVFLAFVIYPVGYGLWLGSDPAPSRRLQGRGTRKQRGFRSEAARGAEARTKPALSGPPPL